jgi:hypothetical protein
MGHTSRLYSGQNSCHKAEVIYLLQRYFFSTVAQSLPHFLIAPFTENVFLPSDEVFDRSLAYLVLLIVRRSGSGIVPIVGIAIGLTQWLPSFFLDRPQHLVPLCLVWDGFLGDQKI